MARTDQLKANLTRLVHESERVYLDVVVPGWMGPQHGMPDTLYGYVMGVFARVDLISAYWKGTFANQTVRMVDFMTHYMQADRLSNSIVVQTWRHKLMHTSEPRELSDPQGGAPYRWLLHWSDNEVPRHQHFRFQPNTHNLNLTLTGLLDDLTQGVERYMIDLTNTPELKVNFDVVEYELSHYEFRAVSSNTVGI